MNPVIVAAVTAERLRKAAEALSGEDSAYISLFADPDTVQQIAVEFGREACSHVVVDRNPPLVRNSVVVRHLGTKICLTGERTATREDAGLFGWCAKDARTASSEEVAAAVCGAVVADIGVM